MILSFRRLCNIALLFVAFISSQALAQADRMFVPVDEKLLSLGAARSAGEIRSRNKSKSYGLFKFNISAMEAKAFVLNLPDGRSVTLERKFLQKNKTHLAYAAGSEQEQVHLTLVTSGTTVSGTLYTQSARYSIDAVGDDRVYLFSAIDPSVVPLHGPTPRVEMPAILEQREREYQEEKKKQSDRAGSKSVSSLLPEPGIATAASGTINVDLMVQYTAQARSYGGGNDATIAADIRNAVAAVNLSFVNSGINVQVNLVDIGYSSYNESGKTLNQILFGWAVLPDIGLRRNQVAADAVMLIASPVGNGCGETIGNTTLEPEPGKAYSAINVACLKSSSPILGHELGHVFAADHNIGASTPPYIATGSAHGWPGSNDSNSTKLWNGQTWYACLHTMMAYPTAFPACTTQPMLYWSDPTKGLSWYYSGTSVQSVWYIGSGTANNVVQMRNAAATVSAFRGPSGGASGGGGGGSEGTTTQSIFNFINRLLGGI